MTSERTRRIFLMARENQTAQKWEIELAEQLRNTLIPKYESTKGSTSFERELAIRGWPQLNYERSFTLEYDDNSIKTGKESLKNYECSETASEDKTSGSEYLPSASDDDSCTSDISNGNSSHYLEIEKKAKEESKDQTNQINTKSVPVLSIHAKLSNTSSTSNSIRKRNIPLNSSEQIQVINPNVSDSEQDKVTSTNQEITSTDSKSKVKIINDIQVKPPIWNDYITTAVVKQPVTAPADSTTIDCNTTSNAVNLVKIVAAKKTITGKRIRNKKHSCYYCHEMILHIARHLEVKHGNEMDVARALAFSKKSNKRKDLFSEITRAGDFHYNCDVISLRQGELILVRRPTMTEIKFNTYRDYGPCPNCLGFMLKKHLWHHMKTKCSKKDLNNQGENPEGANRQIIAESNAILSNVFGTEFSSDYKKHIVNSLRDDDVGNCCREDNLILKFGAMLFEKYGTTQSELIRQNMRQLARLTITVRELTSQNLKLFDLLTPQKFDIVIQGVKELCGRHQNDSTRRPEFITPSLALKLGHSLKKCANIERGLALRQENLRRNECLLAFCNLMDLEWQIRISSNALSTLYKRKINAGQLLPITNDLLKSNNYIKIEIHQAQTNLMKSPTVENWSRLAKLILCRIILFNKRRAGEASKMTLEQYTTRPSWCQQTNEELKAALTPYEIKLAERHVIVNIIGKRGRMVPVLLTPETKSGIDILINHRSESVGINPQNRYIFARASQALTNMRGPDVLRKIVGEIEELEKPDLISSTKLRKYVATVCQVFDLSENENDWLARHLGHDIRVHREFYRLHEDVVELTKVSRLLMAVDSGEANKFAGKQLNDIKLEELPPVEEEKEDDIQELANNEDEAHNALWDERSPIEGTVTSEGRERSNNWETELSKSNGNKRFKRDSLKGTRRVVTRTPWDSHDKKAVFDYFKVQIKTGILPGKTDCEACQEKHVTLKNRKWTDIKYCVKNQIDKIKKIKKD